MVPPPPSTPNPRRFLIGKPTATPTPTPALRQSQHPTISSSQRFNPTPRFSLPASRRPAYDQSSLTTTTPSLPRFGTPVRLSHQDSIEDESSQDLFPLQGSLECEEEFEELVYNDNDDVGYAMHERASKRRRMSPTPMQEGEEEAEEAGAEEEQLRDIKGNPSTSDSEPDQQLFSSSIPSLSSPDQAPRILSTPRFLLPNSTLRPPSTPLLYQATTSLTHPTLHRPPQFLLPDQEQPTQHDPLPEQFSPHRKGQKYIPGGLASTMQSWLLNIDTLSTHHVPIKSEHDISDPYIVKIVVDEESGSGRAGMTMVKGRTVRFEDDKRGIVDYLGFVRFILAGEGFGEGLQKGGLVRKGVMVGLKAPVWEVLVEGSKWGVGVDWKVL